MNPQILSVLIIYLIIALSFGVLGAKFTKSGLDYFCGGKKIGGFIIGFTYIASAMSATGTVGAAGLAYGVGPVPLLTIAFMYNLALIIAVFVVGPKIREYTGNCGSMTIPDFFGHKMGSNSIAGVAALFILLVSIPMIVLNFVGSGYLLQEVTGVSYLIAILIFGAIVIIYAAVGGFLGIAYSDTLQGLVGTVGMVVIIPIAISTMGGWGGLIESVRDVDPQLLTSFGRMPPIVVIAVSLSFFAAVISRPEMTVRLFAVRRTRKDFVTILIIAVLVQTLMVVGPVIAAMAGMTLLPGLETPDTVLFGVVSILMHPIFAGIVLAALLCIMMSTVDSLLLVCSSAVIHDIWNRFSSKKITDASYLKVSRIGTFVLGVLVLVLALNPPEFITLLQAYVLGAIGVVIAIPLVACLFWKRMNRITVYVTWLVGFVSYVGWEVAGQPFGVPTFLLSAPLTIIAMVITGLVTSPDQQLRDDKGNTIETG